MLPRSMALPCTKRRLTKAPATPAMILLTLGSIDGGASAMVCPPCHGSGPQRARVKAPGIEQAQHLGAGLAAHHAAAFVGHHPCQEAEYELPVVQPPLIQHRPCCSGLRAGHVVKLPVARLDDDAFEPHPTTLAGAPWAPGGDVLQAG